MFMYVYIMYIHIMPNLPSKPKRTPRKMMTRVQETRAAEGSKNRKWEENGKEFKESMIT